MNVQPGARFARARRAAVAAVLPVLLVGAVAAAPATAASAVAAPRADKPTPLPNYGPSTGAQKSAVTWSLVPVGPAGLDGRAKYSYTAAPGTAVADLMGISNFSLAPLTLTVYATDAVNVAGGAFGLIPDDQKPSDVGSWIAIKGLKGNQITVPARSRVAVPFTMQIPATATPGDHVGGIVATAATSGSGLKDRKVVTNYRTGSRVYVRVTGDIKAGLTVEDVRASYANNWNPVGRGTVTVTYRVHNTGNVRLSGTQQVTVSSLVKNRRSADGLPPLPELLPGNSVDVTATVSNVLALVLMKADVTVTPVVPAGVSTSGVSAASASTWFWAIPWALLAAILLVLLLWQLDRWRQRRMRRKLAPPPDAPPTEVSLDEVLAP